MTEQEIEAVVQATLQLDDEDQKVIALLPYFRDGIGGQDVWLQKIADAYGEDSDLASSLSL